MDRVAPSAGLPAVDLQALVLAGVAVSPLYLWFLVDSVSEAIGADEPLSQIIFEHVLYVIGMLVDIVGNVAVALGGALILQRRGPRPLSFMITALLVLVAVEVASFGLGWPVAVAQSASLGAGTQYELVIAVLRYACAFVSVALAARLYVHWRQSVADPLDSRRFVAFGVIAIVLAAATTLDWSMIIWRANSDPPIPLLINVTAPLQYFLWALVGSVGAVLLFGSIAAAVVRFTRVEHMPLWVVAAGLSAALVYWMIKYAVPVAFELVYMDLVSRALMMAIVIGVAGSVLYLHAIDARFIRKVIAAVRGGIVNPAATIRALRTWPQRPTEDEER